MSLSLLILLAPATATAYLFTVKPERKGHIRRVAIGASLVTLVGAILMWTSYDPASTEKYQFLTEIEWAPSCGRKCKSSTVRSSMARAVPLSNRRVNSASCAEALIESFIRSPPCVEAGRAT